ncbi:SRPBCC family protein [Galbibacter pacificus]|uniref:SRPBCC family protein n=1 Tax=Galbibacter pacificus TaxID=2996052 RepID=A0ABT6FNU6_9FLAO|nr:SRPBCC family protein [Galbibacter pacificus]MDG3581463.1 SRPBCC family protein [Galbibacter pacificus]MDG3584941.1 SRPBCC family protein [Galbibacter pacificus]
MRILKYLIFLFLIVTIGFAIYIAIQPDNYKVTRTTVINAPQSVLYNYINDTKEWPNWDPWYEKDPNAQLRYGEKTKGVGATYSWNGEFIGKGKIKTTYSTIDSISQNIHFISPYESSAHDFWKLEPSNQQDATIVTWGIEGELGFMEKAVMLFQGGMENNIGPDFERGLKKLDSLVIADMKKYSISLIGKTEYGGGYYLYQTASSKQNEVNLATNKMFPELGAFMEQNYISPSGTPFTLFEEWDDTNNTAIFSACIPVKEKIMTPPGSMILCGYMEPGVYFKTILKGDYVNMDEAWSKTREAIKKNEIAIDPARDAFETYIKSPDEYPNPADLLSEIYIPIIENAERPD